MGDEDFWVGNYGNIKGIIEVTLKKAGLGILKVSNADGI
jgi:hypothetical protein